MSSNGFSIYNFHPSVDVFSNLWLPTWSLIVNEVKFQYPLFSNFEKVVVPTNTESNACPFSVFMWTSWIVPTNEFILI